MHVAMYRNKFCGCFLLRVCCCSDGIPFFHGLNENRGNSWPEVSCMTVVVIGCKETRRPKQSAGHGNRVEGMEL